MPSLQLYGEISFYAFVIHENSLWMSWWGFFFLFFSDSCCLGVAQPKILALTVQEVNSQLRPLKVITCHLFLLHYNPTLCLLLILHVLLPLVHLAKRCSGCLLDLTSRQTCGSRMQIRDVLEPLRGKPTSFGVPRVGNQSAVFWFYR